MMHCMLLFSRQGKLRLKQWYNIRDSEKNPERFKKQLIREVPTIILNRGPRSSNVVEWKDLKVVYRRYASMYFCCVIEEGDNELLILEIIHRYVELLDISFGNVCELDIIYNFEKAHFILNELLLAGEVQETSKHKVVEALEVQTYMEETEAFPFDW